MPKTSSAAEARQRAIEILLLWEGRVSRGRLRDLFDVHETVLSRDLASYRDTYPDACSLKPGNRSYHRSPWARPALTKGRFSEYEQLVGTLPGDGFSAGVPLLSTQQHTTHIAYRLFSRIHTAVQHGQQISIEYRSLSNPEMHRRTIRPHAFIQAGPRWHVRAFCALAGGFRDFNLNRISSVSDPDETRLPDAAADQAWLTMVKLRLVPHPALSPLQEQLVRDEYTSGTTAIVFEVRQAVAKYLVQSFRAAVDAERELPPEFLLAVDKPSALPAGTLF